jgi:hypothetical protein
VDLLSPLPWERLLWTGRSRRLARLVAGERYFLTDFRIVRLARGEAAELAIQDIGDVARVESRLDRLLGTSTIVVHSKRVAPPIVIAGIRRGAQLAAVLELMAGDPRARLDPDAIRAALTFEPRSRAAGRELAAAVAVVLMAAAAVVFGFRSRPIDVRYAADDALAPNGVKRSEAEIMAFMEARVLPWAKTTIGRIKGGSDRVSCETCHGARPQTRGWRMPAVSALPQPIVRERGWEIYSTRMDAQMRNAIYGYAAESEKSAKAAFMREVVVPGMAALLRRAPYDFTKPYAYNQARNALGCYHCHQVR